MALPTTTSFSPLHIRSAETPPKPEKVITPGRELTREERKIARRRNGPMDVLPTFAGKKLTFTLPPADQLNHQATRPANHHPQNPSASHIQSSNIPSSKSHKLKANSKSPLGREIDLTQVAKQPSESSAPDTSKQFHTKSIKGKEKALSVHHGHGLLTKLKSLDERITQNVNLLPVESPSKLFVPGQNNNNDASEIEHHPSDAQTLDLGTGSFSPTVPSSDSVQRDNPPGLRKQGKKSTPPTFNTRRHSQQSVSAIADPSSKKRKISPPHELKSEDMSVSSKSSQDDVSPYQSQDVKTDGHAPRTNGSKTSRNIRAAASPKEGLPLKPYSKAQAKTRRVNSKPQRVEPLQETNPNLIPDAAKDHSMISTQSLSSATHNKENVAPSPAFSHQQFILESFKAGDSLNTNVHLPSSSSIATKPTTPKLDPPISKISVSKAADRPKGRVQVVKRKPEPRELMCDSENTPTVLNTPRASPGSSSDSGKMKTLAAKIFTPGVARKEIKGNRNVKQPNRNADIHTLFDPLAATQETPQSATRPPQQCQPDSGEEQIYIVADRLVRQEDSVEKSIGEGEELSLETQRLLLKIKSQLNPPDIISISIRKLIQDELDKVDQRLMHLPEAKDGEVKDDDDEQERIEAESERAALEGLLENFKAEMLQYSDQLVRYGMLKVKLQRLQALETDLQSQLASSPPPVQPVKRKSTKNKQATK
ncbi:uncharacterized protein VP01_2424g2 [Puccinia sorghi]|uniref:Uncharacterized protein n=1 Tax=Puccinia sorghi TaxID=27349 RepID=A0A0L6V8D0_9BASI|nr:uncharacterized protein VP01_2424g2 [Puccinia sorghi]